MSKNKILSLQYMRAIIIFMIVFWHIIVYIQYPLEKNWLENIARILFANGTPMFVFISGFFFQLNSFKYSAYKFYMAKFKNLFVPYIFISIISVLIFKGSIESIINFGFFKYIINPLNWSLWYVPFIFMVFLFFPILMVMSRKNLLFAAIFSFFIIIVTYRGSHFQSTSSFIIGNLIHFIPCFIIGMWYCQKRAAINDFIEKNLNSVILFFICISIVFIFKQFNHIKYFITNISTLHRILFLILSIYFFEKIKINLFISKVLNYVGDISFTIFFIHMLFVYEFMHLHIGRYEIFEHIQTLNLIDKFLVAFAITILAIAVCAIIASLMKMIFKKNSKFFIGY